MSELKDIASSVWSYFRPWDFHNLIGGTKAVEKWFVDVRTGYWIRIDKYNFSPCLCFECKNSSESKINGRLNCFCSPCRKKTFQNKINKKRVLPKCIFCLSRPKKSNSYWMHSTSNIYQESWSHFKRLGTRKVYSIIAWYLYKRKDKIRQMMFLLLSASKWKKDLFESKVSESCNGHLNLWVFFKKRLSIT